MYMKQKQNSFFEANMRNWLQDLVLLYRCITLQETMLYAERIGIIQLYTKYCMQNQSKKLKNGNCYN